MPKIPFNVDAYTAKLIGRENVSRLDGAVLELVKNTYDADAKVCLVYFEKSTNSLYIGDNGTGMTTEIIQKHWMTIGSSSKTVQFKTQKGRIQTGAKGIGRFALDRIADNCTLLTISPKEHLLWSVDWRTFNFGQKITDTTADLDNVSITFYEFANGISNRDVIRVIEEDFNNTGTLFKLTDLRDVWDTETIESIRFNLKTLIPPEFKAVFNIFFFEENTAYDDAAILKDGDEFQYDYKIRFEVEKETAKIMIHRDEFDFKEDFDRIVSNAGFTQEDKAYFKGQLIEFVIPFSDLIPAKVPVANTIGTFSGTLYFAKLSAPSAEREKYYYKDITGRKDIRDSFGGIRIYRDGFRVRPYGEPKTSASDWLSLAARKNKSPAAISHTGAWRVNSDQIHGSVYISRMNITLPDQSNRQGIVETKEFRLLQQFLESVIKMFERDRQYVGRILNNYYDLLHPTAKYEAELAKKVKEENKRKAKNETKSKSNDDEKFTPEVIEVSKVSEILDKRDSTIQELENDIKLLRVLATTGIVTNTYVHEIKELTHKLSLKIMMTKESLELDRDIDSAINHINAANELRDSFNSWFKVTIESVRMDKRSMQNVDLNNLLLKLVTAWNETLKPKNILIHTSLEEVEFRCFPYEIESIVNNLITNSVSSFEGEMSTDKNLYISLRPSEFGVVLDYSDDGRGLSSVFKKDPKLILEPFETDKRASGGEPIGTGMGMWIVNRTVAEYNGTIDLSKNTTTENGFHIAISLNSKRLEVT